MHAVSYADHMLLLEHFTNLLSNDKISAEDLTSEVEAWAERVSPSLTNAPTFQRQVHQLMELFSESGEGSSVARTGLLYLLRSGGPSPENLTAIALQAHSFVLSIILHKARTAMGRTAAFVPPELSAEDRSRADEIFSGALASPLYSDAELIRQTRAFVESPGLPTDSLFFRRLLHSAEFLAEVLEGGFYSKKETNYARAALSYLVLEEDSIDDRLGLIGFLDDAYILDMAVGFIEPARKPWMRLIEAAAEAETLLKDAMLTDSEGKSTKVNADFLVDAALLSEPMADLGAPISGALFLPTAGSATVLLGAAVARAVIEEAGGGEAGASLADFGSQMVIVASPEYRSEKLIREISIAGRGLTDVIPTGSVSEDGKFEDEGAAIQPVLVLAPSLGAAARMVEEYGSQIRMILVDLEVASGGDAAEVLEDDLIEEPIIEPVEEDEEDEGDLAVESETLLEGKATAKKKAKKPRKDSDAASTYMGETGFIPRLTRDQEKALSVQMLEGRQEVYHAVAALGPLAIQVLADQSDKDETIWAELRELSGRGSVDDVVRILTELSLEDETYSEIERQYKEHHRNARALNKFKNRPGKQDQVKALEAQLGMSLDAFISGYRKLLAGLHSVDEAVHLLTRGNLRLVLWMAKKYRNRTSFFLDMVQEGNMGLMRAARKFDYRKGAGFGTYANWWVRQSIERYLSHHSRTIRIPVTALAAVRRVRDAVREIERQTGESATAQNVSDRIGMDLQEVRRIMRVSHELEHGCVALDGPLDSESGTTFGDLVADPEAAQPLEELSSRQLGLEARKLLDTLEPLEAKVLRMRFGIGNDTRHTLEQIGNQVGLTRERIRQIEIKALGKLKFRAKRLGVRP